MDRFFSFIRRGFPYKLGVMVRIVIWFIVLPVHASDVRDICVIGVQANPSPAHQLFLQETIHRLNRLMEDRIYIVQDISTNDLFKEETYQKYHAVIVSPQVFAILERFNGYAAMASLGKSGTGDAFRSTLTAGLFVPVGKQQIFVNDLSNGNIGLMESDLPDTALLIREEWRHRGLSPSSVSFMTFKTIQELEQALQAGRIDAVAVSSDWKDVFSDESLLQAKAVTTANRAFSLTLGQMELTMVEPHTDDWPEEASSTPQVPGWVFAAGLGLKRDQVAALSATLKSLTFDSRYRWLPAGDYDPVLQALIEVQDPSYRLFPTRKWTDMIKDNLQWLALFLLILLGVIWHSVAAERLVRIRTRELWETMQKNRLAEKRFEDLERMTAVSQMSNIVAHELRQPLAAVSNFSLGLRQRIKNGNLNEEVLNFALTKILDENKRASDIVEHVRNYAKRRERKYESLNVRTLALKVAAAFLPNDGEPFIQVTGDENVKIRADSLEMELILRNLVKNAVEAVGESPDRAISICLQEQDSAVCLRVLDNGPLQDEQQLFNNASPLMSEKSSGLGLGLSIVRRLVESYDGQLTLKVQKPHGVIAEIIFPNEAVGRSDLSKGNGYDGN